MAAQKKNCIKMLVYTSVYIYAYIFIVNGPIPKYVLLSMYHELKFFLAQM
jgi:hypothetical protein